jgi:hypothetical protein
MILVTNLAMLVGIQLWLNENTKLNENTTLVTSTTQLSYIERHNLMQISVQLKKG